MNINFINTHIHPNFFPSFDPLNPPRTASESRFSYDPIHPDALAIVEKLKNARTESEVREIVWDSFRDLIMDEIAGDRDYREAVFYAWKWYMK